MSELARWDHAKWLQDRLGEARQTNAELEVRVVALEEASEGAWFVLNEHLHLGKSLSREDLYSIRDGLRAVLDTGKRET